MRVSTSISALTIALAAPIAAAACGGSNPGDPAATATVSGVVGADTGGVIAGASVKIGSATATTGADGRFELRNLPVGTATMLTSAPGFAPRSESINLGAGTHTHDVELTLSGDWGLRADLIEPNSELALAEANGKLYLLGGYPASRQTSRTVQIYDIASDRWELGPPLPQPNNHGMAASVNGKI